MLLVFMNPAALDRWSKKAVRTRKFCYQNSFAYIYWPEGEIIGQINIQPECNTHKTRLHAVTIHSWRLQWTINTS